MEGSLQLCGVPLASEQSLWGSNGSPRWSARRRLASSQRCRCGCVTTGSPNVGGSGVSIGEFAATAALARGSRLPRDPCVERLTFRWRLPRCVLTRSRCCRFIRNRAWVCRRPRSQRKSLMHARAPRGHGCWARSTFLEGAWPRQLVHFQAFARQCLWCSPLRLTFKGKEPRNGGHRLLGQRALPKGARGHGTLLAEGGGWQLLTEIAKVKRRSASLTFAACEGRLANRRSS